MSVFLSAAGDGIEPPARLTVSEWADRYRYLSPEGSAEHGPWRTERTPYLREIMDNLSETSPVCVNVFAKGSQIGATEAGVCWAGYVIDRSPGPMLILMPTDDTVQTNVRTRYDPMIEACPSVRAKVPPKGSKDGGNTLNYKSFPGGAMVFRGTNSPAGLAGNPIGKLHFDEVDRAPRDSGGEGSPLVLARRRLATFGAKRKEFYTSTPTIEGESQIWDLFEATDQRYYNVPCPHCGEFQAIEWAQIKWKGDGAPWLECVHNGCVIEERSKPGMLANGKWIPTAECPDPSVRGYHLSALYSPLGWYSWFQAREEFLAAHRLMKKSRDATAMKAWVNTVLGLPFAEKGEAPPWEVLYSRRGDYERNKVPAGGLMLTAAADVQSNRIEVEIRAWGPNFQSWSVDKRVFPGDAGQASGPRSPWPAMDALLSESWEHELGGRIAITTLAIDSSDQTQAVYNWTRNKPTSRVMAVKGSSDRAHALISVPKRVDVRIDGKTVEGGATLWIVGTALAKSELYTWLKQSRPAADEPVPTGWMHWPTDYDQEWFEQLTAESLVMKVQRGYRTFVWEKNRERNEALDLAVYNRAAAAMIGVDRFEQSKWESLAAQLTVHAPAPGAPSPALEREASTAHAKIKPRKPASSFWDR